MSPPSTGSQRTKRRAAVVILLLAFSGVAALAFMERGSLASWFEGRGGATPLESTSQGGSGATGATPVSGSHAGTDGGSGDGLTPRPPGGTDPFNLTGSSGPAAGETNLHWLVPPGVDGGNLTLTRTSTNGTTANIPVNGTSYVDRVTPGASYTYTIQPAPSEDPAPSSSAPVGGSTPVTVVAYPGSPAVPTPELPGLWLVAVGGAVVVVAMRRRS